MANGDDEYSISRTGPPVITNIKPGAEIDGGTDVARGLVEAADVEGTAVEPEPEPIKPDGAVVKDSRLIALKTLFSRLAEQASGAQAQESNKALRWFLAGQALAYQLAAARVEETLEPSVHREPPDLEKLLQMFETTHKSILEMIQAGNGKPKDTNGHG